MNPIIDNPLSWVYFPTAFALGALHALEPGHAKTLTAAYLIGIKGTKRDALLLGLSVAVTHSLVVIGISVAALWVGRETFTQDVTHWLQIGSGIIVILLGLWMLIRRLRQQYQLKASHGHHHHESEVVQISNPISSGILSIVMRNNEERLQYAASSAPVDLHIRAIITRPEGLEVIGLFRESTNSKYFVSKIAPREPHEFQAELELTHNNQIDVVPFEMHESEHHHDHDHMTDDEHARAHAATIPDYAKRGERPSLTQILSFGAAGGMIPCPASITVMLLALSIGQFASGLLAVAGFSIGLAATLVGIGLIVVAGISRIEGSGKMHWFSSRAPVLSAMVVILSGCAALLFAH